MIFHFLHILPIFKIKFFHSEHLFFTRYLADHLLEGLLLILAELLVVLHTAHIELCKNKE